MKWVTRERPKIDRIACPWLIERFIEKQPEFLYVPADKVLATAKETGAIPYDIPGVKFSHVGEKCSFDAFIAEYKLSAPGLDKLADIVRGADTSRLDLTPQSAGLFAISLGLSPMHQVVPQPDGRDAQLAAEDGLSHDRHHRETGIACRGAHAADAGGAHRCHPAAARGAQSRGQCRADRGDDQRRRALRRPARP